MAQRSRQPDDSYSFRQLYAQLCVLHVEGLAFDPELFVNCFWEGCSGQVLFVALVVSHGTGKLLVETRCLASLPRTIYITVKFVCSVVVFASTSSAVMGRLNVNYILSILLFYIHYLIKYHYPAGKSRPFGPCDVSNNRNL